MRIFGSDRMKRILETLRVPEDEPIESGMVSRAVEAAQAKVEGFYFDARKHVLEYDGVMNKQRDAFYRLRQSILDAGADAAKTRDLTVKVLTEALLETVKESRLAQSDASVSPDDATKTALERFTTITADEWSAIQGTLPPDASAELPEDMERALRHFVEKHYDQKAAASPQGVFPEVCKVLLLRTLDFLWTDHLDTMEYLRTGIGLRGYGQRDPLVEYRHESHHLFQNLLAHFRQEAAAGIFHVTIHPEGIARAPAPTIALPARMTLTHPTAPTPTGVIGQEVDTVTPSGLRTALAPSPVLAASSPGATAAGQGISPRAKPNVGRNDPCPCGSGKKYKKCHGA